MFAISLICDCNIAHTLLNYYKIDEILFELLDLPFVAMSESMTDKGYASLYTKSRISRFRPTNV